MGMRRRALARLAAAALVLATVACSDEVVLDDGATDLGNRGREDTVEASDAGADSVADTGDGLNADRGAPDSSEDDLSVGPLSRDRIVIPGAESLPDAFDGATESVGGRAVVYPADGTLMPLNVAPVLFQWEGPSGGAYRLRIEGPERAFDVYTTEWSWEPGETVWRTIASAGSNSRMHVSVDELVGGSVLRGERIEVSFSAAAVEGAIYFWAPSQNGIVRLPLGETESELFLSGTVFNCVGCHALSPDGSRLAYTRSSGGTPIGNLGVVGTDDGRFDYVTPGSIAAYYPSFAPDNVRLAAARGGEIIILNSDTGLVEETLPRPGGTSANHPAWSPAGSDVVFAAGDSGFGPMDSLGVSASGLVRVSHDGDDWGSPEWLAQSGSAANAGETMFYPAYSPDGRWVVFNRADEGVAPGGSPAGAELWLVSNERGGPIHLELASGGSATTNSWPKWAPASGDGTLWIAFTSTRAYGRVDTGGSQIWIAAIDPDIAATGRDPSSAAFRMPFQPLGNSNHVAYWAEFQKE